MAQLAAPIKAGINEQLPALCNLPPSQSTEVLAPLQFVGGGGGSQYTVKGWQDGKLVRKLRVYSGEWQIKAIRLWMSGDEEGDYKQFGNPDNTNYRDFTFEDGERVTQMSLWGNGAGTRAGWIEFHTNKNKSFSFGMYGWPKKQKYDVNVGSGILVGAIYNAGADIDAHGYYFLKASVASTQVTDVSYPTLQWDTKHIAPVALDSYAQTNTSSNPISWHFGDSDTVTTNSSWTSSTDRAFEVKLSIEAAISEVVKGGASAKSLLTSVARGTATTWIGTLAGCYSLVSPSASWLSPAKAP